MKFSKQDQERINGSRILKVFRFPQNGSDVPAVRVAGQWLKRFGFGLGDLITLQAKQNKIVIRMSEKSVPACPKCGMYHAKRTTCQEFAFQERERTQGFNPTKDDFQGRGNAICRECGGDMTDGICQTCEALDE